MQARIGYRSLAAFATVLLGSCGDLPTAAPREPPLPGAAFSESGASAVFSGSGTMAITGVTLLDLRVADGNRFFTRSLTGTFTGTLAGTFTSVVVVTQRDNGIETVRGTRLFTGTVAGRSGSCEIRVEAAGVVPSSFQGHWTITSCTGGLEGLHGHGTFVSTGLGTSAYSGEFHFTS